MLEEQARLLQTALGEDDRAIESYVRKYDVEAALEVRHAALGRPDMVF